MDQNREIAYTFSGTKDPPEAGLSHVHEEMRSGSEAGLDSRLTDFYKNARRQPRRHLVGCCT